MKYKNLEQRMAQAYIDMFPEFAPDKEAPVSESEQKDFYLLMKGFYQLAFDEPLLFVNSLHEDDAFPNHSTKSSYGKPDLQKDMYKFTKEVDTLLQKMFLAGKDSSVDFSKRQLDVLQKAGIGDLTKLPKAWTWMSNRPEANILTFRHCHFDKDHQYLLHNYARLLGEEAFGRLDKWMIDHGYIRHNIYNITKWGNRLSLTYANPAWSSEEPKEGFEYKIRHTGISVRYEPWFQNPCIFGLCIPNGLKVFLKAFDSMNAAVQDFTVSRTKKCNECRYCVQTDKTGSRPLAFVKIKHKQKEYKLCTYFPGYYYSWSNIDNDLADKLIEMLSFMDCFAPKTVIEAGINKNGYIGEAARKKIKHAKKDKQGNNLSGK